MDSIQYSHSVETRPHRTRKLARLTIAVGATLALIGSGLVMGGSATAHAAPLENHSFTFTAPKGEDWVVPEGVTEVLVGLRGGDGGCVRCDQPGGEGKSYLLHVDVQPGDTLTLFAGHSASDYSRTAGKGFVDGGKGGDKSRSAMSGNGGGGAAALQRNGELLAVAGGGGGGGGRGGDRDFRPFTADFDFGGGGGNASTGAKPTWGEGKHAGNPGKNGVDDPTFARYGKAGENGKDAGFMSSGGGGGAGGGGWPASGTAGGSGKKRLGFGAGSGGGAGTSWLAPATSGVTVLSDGKTPNVEFTYVGPLAKFNTVQVTIPLQLHTELGLQLEATAGSSFAVHARTHDTWRAEASVDGTFELLRDGAVIASGSTDGDLLVPVDPLEAGTYTLTYRFTAKHRMGEYWENAATTVDELQVTVGASAANGADTPTSDGAKTGDAAPAPEAARDSASGTTDDRSDHGVETDAELCVIDEPASDSVTQHDVSR